MDVVRTVRESNIYAVVSTLRRWARGSTVLSMLTREEVLQGLLAIVLIVSTTRVALTNLNAAVKFLSFVVLFLLVVVIALPFTEPSSE
ncbi:hypothetical protein M0R88_04090 [Halorussus gelatinilyticus]|uniref:Uncharacterized protein n=1 Tax=Halorussus gelatinilyticus TaxID=2937524 RepID=A0A8U0IJJ2_9EURY|nr:hypothetical protein [Halorussus gelatinilyticus]UPW01290.1 hypothetical protein M0R88_04090 [Halorussus gelatinilyticus]